MKNCKNYIQNIQVRLSIFEDLNVDEGMGPSLYYVSKELGGCFQKMDIFPDVQYCIYADIVGGSKIC